MGEFHEFFDCKWKSLDKIKYIFNVPVIYI